MLKKLFRLKRDIERSKILQLENIALQQIQKIFPEPFFIPVTNWSVSPSAVLYMMNDILINSRRQVVEFGAGMSTIYIAQLIKLYRLDVRFYSVEADANWKTVMEGYLSQYGLSEFVTIVHAPMAPIDKGLAHKDQQSWYDAQVLSRALGSLDRIDLVLVDGPFGGSTPFARFSAVPFLKPRLADSYAIFLDDTGRPMEDEILTVWAGLLECQVKKAHDRYALLYKGQGFSSTPIFM